MMTNAQAIALETSENIARANARWEIADAPHALAMGLIDLMVWAACAGVDFDTELASAREAFADVYDPADLASSDEVRARIIAAALGEA